MSRRPGPWRRRLVDAGGTTVAARDGGAGAGNLENGRALAPGQRAAPAITELRLPWSVGETWYLTSGPHSTKRAALDFAPPNVDPRTGKVYADLCSRKRGEAYWVRAAADGYFTAVLRKGCPCVQIQHDDGTTTNYFHLRRGSVKRLGFKVGDAVRAGQAPASVVRGRTEEVRGHAPGLRRARSLSSDERRFGRTDSRRPCSALGLDGEGSRPPA